MEEVEGWGEPNSLEDDVNNWIANAFEEYTEVMPMINEVKENIIKIEMLEKVYVIEISSETNLPASIKPN